MARTQLEVVTTREMEGDRQEIVATKPAAPGLARFTGVVDCDEFGRLARGDPLVLTLEAADGDEG